jgi:phospholipase C
LLPAAATLAARGVSDGDPGCVMGYYDGTDVPVYDHLAEEFAVCDRWFSSVAGATLPNRLYALCGVAAGSRDDRPSYLPPLYHQPSFVRHLDAAGHPRAASRGQGRSSRNQPGQSRA